MRVTLLFLFAMISISQNIFAATDLKPDLVIDLDSKLGFSDSTLFYQVGNDVKTFDLSTKKSRTSECNFTSGKIYTSWVLPLGTESYLIYRMSNASPNEYRIYNKSGTCWSLHSGDSDTLQFYTVDPQTGNLVVGLSGDIKILDIKTGRVLQSNLSSTLSGYDVSQSLVTDGKLVVFASTTRPFTAEYKIQVYDLKSKTQLSNFFTTQYFRLLKKIDSKILTEDFDNNIYYLDLNNIEFSLSKSNIKFSFDKECARPTFYTKDRMILCEINGSYGSSKHTLQYLGDSEIIFPWESLIGKFAIYSTSLKSAVMFGDDKYFHFYNVTTGTRSKVEANGEVIGIQSANNGRLYYANIKREIYEFDSYGTTNKLYNLTQLPEGNGWDDLIYFNKSNNVLSYLARDYKVNKFAIYGITLE